MPGTPRSDGKNFFWSSPLFGRKMLRKFPKCLGPVPCKSGRDNKMVGKRDCHSIIPFFNNNSTPPSQYLRDKILLKKGLGEMLFFFFFPHCPLFREGCGGSSSRLSRHTSRSSITSIILLGRSPKRFYPRSSM